MAEIWRLVEECPAYEVSSEGRIRRILPGKRTRVGKIVRSEGNTRYRTATLVYQGKRHYVHIHTLVCRTFHGPKPSPDHQAAHLNGDNHYNWASNLAWSTQLENEQHKLLHGTKAEGEKVGGSKLTRTDVKNIRSSYAKGHVSYTELAREFNVNLTTVKRAVLRQTWSCVAD